MTDAYLDQVLDKELFEKRKEVEESISSLTGQNAASLGRMQEFLELAGSVYLLYQTAISEKKRELVMKVTSNRRAVSKNVEITLAGPFRSIAERHDSSNSAPCWDIPRTMSQLLGTLVKFCSNVEARVSD